MYRNTITQDLESSKSCTLVSGRDVVRLITTYVPVTSVTRRYVDVEKLKTRNITFYHVTFTGTSALILSTSSPGTLRFLYMSYYMEVTYYLTMQILRFLKLFTITLKKVNDLNAAMQLPVCKTQIIPTDPLMAILFTIHLYFVLTFFCYLLVLYTYLDIRRHFDLVCYNLFISCLRKYLT